MMKIQAFYLGYATDCMFEQNGQRKLWKLMLLPDELHKNKLGKIQLTLIM